MLYNWAAESPGKVDRIGAIYPVCDQASWPGLEKSCGAYGLTAAELKARLAEHNPIDRLAPLARAGIPLLHLHGNADDVVPLEANSGELARRYRALGGAIELGTIAGRGHQVCPEFFEAKELLEVLPGRRAPVPGDGDRHRFPPGGD
jgi:pimeloyl-ACP methyl ester carboxylesterase